MAVNVPARSFDLARPGVAPTLWLRHMVNVMTLAITSEL